MNSKKIRVALYLSKMTVPAKINFGQDVAQAILHNAPVFSAPGTIVTDLQTATEALESAWNAAQDGGKSLTATMHIMEKQFDVAMIRVAHYVEGVADGDENTVYLAKFRLAGKNNSQKHALSVKAGRESGQVILTSEAHRGAVYLWQYSTDPANAGSWTNLSSGTRSRQLADGLTQGTRYSFRVTYIDKDGTHPYSEVLSLLVP